MKPEKILIFELNWMGDILFSFPFIRSVRNTFPDACIGCAVVPRYAELLADNPWINRVYLLSDNRGVLSMPEKLMFVAKIKKEKYDTCFFLKPSKTKAVMAVMAGIKNRIGFEGKRAALTGTVKTPAGGTHQADQLLALGEAAGMIKSGEFYEYFVSAEAGRCVRPLLDKAGGGLSRIVAFNPGGNWSAKRWPADRFVDLAGKLLARFDDIEIMITGFKKDTGLTEDMVSRISSGRCYSMAGKTGLNELAALFKECELVISADSGPLHLASAVGTATIGLFGPTSPAVTGPKGKGKNIVISHDAGCSVPCYRVEECDKEYECMKAITVDEVFSAAERALV